MLKFLLENVFICRLAEVLKGLSHKMYLAFDDMHGQF
jgi:hypothetical protein